MIKNPKAKPPGLSFDPGKTSPCSYRHSTENSALDLWTIFRFSAGLLGGKDLEKSLSLDATEARHPSASGFPFILRRLKNVAKDLPPKIERKFLINSTGTKLLIENLERERLDHGENLRELSAISTHLSSLASPNMLRFGLLRNRKK